MDALCAAVLPADVRMQHGGMIRKFLCVDAALIVVVPHPTSPATYRVYPASLAMLLTHGHTPSA